MKMMADKWLKLAANEVQKKYGQKIKCKLLMKGHTIRWNGMKIKYSQGDDLKALLNTAGVTVKD